MIAAAYELAIEIGDMPVVVRTQSEEFARMLEDRYGSFVTTGDRNPVFELDIELIEPAYGIRQTGDGKEQEPGCGVDDPYDRDLSVRLEAGLWRLERGDFYAELDPGQRRGWVRQAAQPYAIDGVLRILHSLLLAREGGFLLHAASAVRYGRAFVFAGVSGAGKTTISRLAPPDVTLLTDEISYVVPMAYGIQQTGEGKRDVSGLPYAVSRVPSYEAFGTPFAGELARIGTKIRAPLAMVFLLEQGPENRIEPVSDSQAARELMRHVLFFVDDPELVGRVFGSICDLVSRVAVRRLVFRKDASVWGLIP